MANNKELQEELIDSLVPAYDEFIGVLEQFSNAQLNEIPFEGSWTPGQVADHIIKATSGIPDKNTVTAGRSHDEKMAALKSVFLDFSQKLKSPEFVLPAGGPFVKSEQVARLQELKAKHLGKIQQTDLTALCLGFELPTIGTMTRYEWFKFIVVHINRHLYQLNNISKVMENS